MPLMDDVKWNLDDRKFQDIVDECKSRITRYCPEWTDHNVHDPGITLIELFAWMVESLIYRLNKVPEKNFIKFFELMGESLLPPTPARVDLTFLLAKSMEDGDKQPSENSVVIPKHCEVSTARSQTESPVVFQTDKELNIQPAKLECLSHADNIIERKKISQNEPLKLMLENNKTNVRLGFSNDISSLLLEAKIAIAPLKSESPQKKENSAKSPIVQIKLGVSNGIPEPFSLKKEENHYLPYDIQPDNIKKVSVYEFYLNNAEYYLASDITVKEGEGSAKGKLKVKGNKETEDKDVDYKCTIDKDQKTVIFINKCPKSSYRIPGYSALLYIDCDIKPPQKDSGNNSNDDPVKHQFTYNWYAISETKDNKINIDVVNEMSENQTEPIAFTLKLPSGLKNFTDKDKDLYWLGCDISKANSQELSGVKITSVTVVTKGVTVTATHCQTIENEELGTSDGTPGQSFKTQYRPVLDRQARERIKLQLSNGKEEKWDEVFNFSHTNKVDRHYILDSVTGTVQFGPKLYSVKDEAGQKVSEFIQKGRIPPEGSKIILAKYRYGGGNHGNVASKQLTVLKSSVQGVSQVINHEQAKGGSDGETVEEAVNRISQTLMVRDRAVTKEDFEYLAKKAHSGVIKAKCVCRASNKLVQKDGSQEQEIKQGNIIVKVYIVLKEGDETMGSENKDRQSQSASEILESVKNYLQERAILGTKVEVVIAIKKDVEINLSSKKPVESSGTDSNDRKTEIEELIKHYLDDQKGGDNGTGWPFGEEVKQEDIQRYLETQIQDIGDLTITVINGELEDYKLPTPTINWK
ncbi:MAG: putative baseplate assembly protein [Desulfamplus sp.]